ncbi:hypothetical protein ACZ90_45740 [Streptomyces albus subsp. albus]|nr:hypothetical protein ACZ90_45740 [Streptomyces albus subsp. albus]
MKAGRPVAERPPRPSGRDRSGLWSWRTALVSASVLFVGGALALEGAAYLSLADETPVPQDEPVWSLVMLPVVALPAILAGLLVTVLVVFPSLGLARRLGGRRWPLPAVAMAAAGALTALVALWWDLPPSTALALWPLLGVVVTTAAALAALSRHRIESGRKPSLIWRVYAYGALAALGIAGLSAAAQGMGLFEKYRPPTVAHDDLAGTWTDGEGGRLRLAPDGSAVAHRLRSDDSGVELGPASCSGSGSWSFEPAADPWEQTVEIDVAGCPDEWHIGGSPRRLGLNHVYGDPDSPDWYRLRHR